MDLHAGEFVHHTKFRYQCYLKCRRQMDPIKHLKLEQCGVKCHITYQNKALSPCKEVH